MSIRRKGLGKETKWRGMAAKSATRRKRRDTMEMILGVTASTLEWMRSDRRIMQLFSNTQAFSKVNRAAMVEADDTTPFPTSLRHLRFGAHNPVGVAGNLPWFTQGSPPGAGNPGLEDATPLGLKRSGSKRRGAERYQPRPT